MNKSVWFSEKETAQFPPLTQKVKTDVAIVGGGIAGIFCAYLLAKEGKKVVLVEKNQIGSGQTGYTTAFITYAVDKTLAKMVEKFGEENAKLVWEVGEKAISEIEKIISQEKIECDFLRCNAHIVDLNQKNINILKKEAELGQKLGFEVSFKIDDKLNFENFGYLQIAEQAKFHPLKFLYQLTKKAKEAGVLIFENTEALDIDEANPVQVTCESGVVEAEYAIVDTYNPVIAHVVMPGKLISYQSYACSLLIKKGILEEAIYWDTEKPYNYFRLDTFNNFDRLILGGRDHLTNRDPNPGKHFQELEEYFKKKFKHVEYKIEASWSGEILESTDGIPYIGHSPLNPSVLLSTGFSGNGMTYSAISAMLNRDLILGKANKYKVLFDPQRMDSIGHYAKSESFSQTQEIYEEKISSNSGKVVEINGKKVAIYKDEDG
jgi:glycine/D-amino acid oxidase-like deaminating enzyme